MLRQPPRRVREALTDHSDQVIPERLPEPIRLLGAEGLERLVFAEPEGLLGFAIAPGYWDWLEASHARGALASIDAVRHELLRQDDELSAWTRRLPSSFWIDPAPTFVDSLRTIANWTMNPDHQYRSAARSTFLDSADFQLIAAAHAGGHVVVTREKSEPNAKKRITIPDACRPHQVRHVSPFELSHAERLRLVSDRPRSDVADHS